MKSNSSTNNLLSNFVIFSYFISLSITFSLYSFPDQKIKVIGKVTKYSTNKPLANTNIKILNQNTGTTSDKNGNYQLLVSPGTLTIVFSYIGYFSQQKTITLSHKIDSLVINIALEPKVIPGKEVTISAFAEEAKIARYEIPPAKLRTIVNPLPDALLSLKTLPGVSSSNDQSTFYNVRGGNYDENLIYLNGIEIYQPLLVRKGIAENSSLVNPNLLQSINLRTGAFPVQYGDKLSSVLDIKYKEGNRERVSGLAALSAIKGEMMVEGPLGKKASWILGIRKVNYGYLFNALRTKGIYTPDFKDVQLAVSYDLNPKNKIQFLGIYGNSKFLLKPESWSSRSFNSEVWAMNIKGSESFVYQTTALGLQWFHKISDRLQTQINLSLFDQKEDEDNHSEYFITQTAFDSVNIFPDSTIASGANREEIFKNNFNVSLSKLFCKADYQIDFRHRVNFGLELKLFKFKDRLYEKIEAYDKLETDPPDLINSSTNFNSFGISFFGEHSWSPVSYMSIRSGLRLTEYFFNKEPLLMPRLNLLFNLTEKTNLMLAAGRYSQPPLYKEFRSRGGEQSSNLKAQKSTQFTVGLEHKKNENLSFRVEAYYKRLHDLISYDLMDVRIVYSGMNDAVGYVYGLETHLRGEFIPDCIAWLSYSYMVARENLKNDNEGWVPRPSDQRHLFAAALQDKMDRFPGSRLHIRILFGSGYPYTYRYVKTNDNGESEVVLGKRNSSTTRFYRRFDIGFTQKFKLGNISVTLKEEILNLFNMYNVMGYSWISGAKVEHGLSKRTYNIGISAQF
ncbi:TonB-dependent receptor [candidate division KSB1 bacterium]|nr:TonB-dependent receptor [candidate division KSB1 bacterium]